VRLIGWSVEHPALILAGYAGMVLLSLLCLALWIPTRLVPSLKSPLLAVVTACPNWTAEDVESRLTDPLERSLAQVPDVRSLRSQSMHGLSTVVLEFPYGFDTQTALTRLLGQIPALPFPPRLIPFDPLDLPVLRLAVHAPGKDDWELRQLLEREVMISLKRVPGVERVSLFGPRLQWEVTPRVGVDSSIPQGYRNPQTQETPVDLRPALTGVTRGSQFKDLKIGDRPLSEVAQVRLQTSHNSPRYRYNGQDGFEINLFQKDSSSAPTTVQAVRQALETIARQHPDLIFQEAYNNAHFVQVTQANVWRELTLAVALTGLVVYVFLGDLRGTLIALATVPTSLALALTLFVPLGLSLNSSTLIGLLLALGRLVDDTIIDLHAVGHHRALGKDSRQAAVDGCCEVRPAVLSSTLVLGLAMLPLTWCGGLTQDMFEGIVWPFLLALAASLAVSLTLTPVLAAYAYRRFVPKPRRWLEDRYRRLLQSALRQRAWLLGLALAGCYLAWLLFPLLGSEMMPLADTGQIYAELESQPGTSSEETARLAVALEEMLRRQPEVLGVSTEVGMEEEPSALSGYEMGGSHMARMWITLTDQHQRQRSLWQIADSVYARALHEIPGLRRLVLKEMGSDVMASSMAPVQLVITGPNLKRLAWLGEQTRALGLQLRGLSMVSTSWAPGQAARAPFRNRIGAGQQLTTTVEGVPVVLQDGVIAKSEFSVIEHDNLRRSISVMGSIRRGGPGSMRLSMDLQMASQSQLPYPAGYAVEQRGDMVQMMDSFRRLLGGLLLSLGLICLALVVQFSGWQIPLIMMMAIPLELSGVCVALLCAGQTLSSVSLLGLVVLHGMDVTASILLLDSVVRARRAGADCHQALLEGAPHRLRPVLMTVAVTLAVMLPLALFPSTGLDAYAPLATVVLGGLSVSCLLTLVIVPVLYSYTRQGN
jgi:HAE1 family hydrophobic/amphiphilic exporter-1